MLYVLQSEVYKKVDFMKIKRFTLIKTIAIIFVLLYFIAFNNMNTMIFDAIITLSLSLFWLIKNKKNNLVFSMSLFIFYCIYSITVGEYFLKSSLGVPMSEVNTTYIYGLSIRVLMLFVFIVTLFTDDPNRLSLQMRYKGNNLIYYFLIFVLLLVGLFGVNRNIGSSYKVNTTPIYEYSTILFLFAYYSSGNSKKKKIFISLILFIFALQDFYLGGRITALQLMIVFLFCMLDDILTSKKIVIGAILGIVLNFAVASYRLNYSLNQLSILSITKDLIKNKFVFDTATYSYYATATHIASIEYADADIAIRLKSLFEFIKAIFLGSNNPISNVTQFVSDNYFLNIGGGLFPSHFYFWLGWSGVAFSAIILVFFLNKLMKSNTDYSLLSLAIIVITSPRWFLYSPLVFFRTQFILGILYILFRIGHNTTILLSKRGIKL